MIVWTKYLLFPLAQLWQYKSLTLLKSKKSSGLGFVHASDTFGMTVGDRQTLDSV
jgi:hypothetical protein